jgi:hypothetical protein
LTRCRPYGLRKNGNQLQLIGTQPSNDSVVFW